MAAFAITKRLRIGKPDVLDRHAHDTARDIERRLASIQHAAEIIERGIGVGAAHRLVQRADQIVVAVLRFVVDRRAPLYDLLQLGAESKISSLRAARQTSSASVSAARPSPSAMRLSASRASASERKPPVSRCFPPAQATSRSPPHREMEDKHARARQERRVEFEGRAFGGSADQNDRAIFHHRRETSPAGRD